MHVFDIKTEFLSFLIPVFGNCHNHSALFWQSLKNRCFSCSLVFSSVSEPMMRSTRQTRAKTSITVFGTVISVCELFLLLRLHSRWSRNGCRPTCHLWHTVRPEFWFWSSGGRPRPKNQKLGPVGQTSQFAWNNPQTGIFAENCTLLMGQVGSRPQSTPLACHIACCPNPEMFLCPEQISTAQSKCVASSK